MLQDLTKVKNKFCSFFLMIYKGDISGKVLSEIKDSFSCRCVNDLFDRHIFHLADRKTVSLCELSFDSRLHCLVNLVFLFFPKKMVDNLTIINTVIFDVRSLIVPCIVCSDHLLCSIDIADMQFCNQKESAAKILCHSCQPEFSFVPAISERNGKSVFFSEKFCHIEGQVLFFFVIVTVVRSQDFVSNFSAIQFCLKKSKSADV